MRIEVRAIILTARIIESDHFYRRTDFNKCIQNNYCALDVLFWNRGSTLEVQNLDPEYLFSVRSTNFVGTCSLMIEYFCTKTKCVLVKHTVTTL